jgi:uncharacterized MnhB-related membrane protein
MLSVLRLNVIIFTFQKGVMVLSFVVMSAPAVSVTGAAVLYVECFL